MTPFFAPDHMEHLFAQIYFPLRRINHEGQIVEPKSNTRMKEKTKYKN